MSDFKTRLNEEIEQLKDKTEKLSAFLSSENSNKIDATQHILLKVQLDSMRTYLNVIEARYSLLT